MRARGLLAIAAALGACQAPGGGSPGDDDDDDDPGRPDGAPDDDDPSRPDAGGIGGRWHPPYLSIGTIYEGDAAADAFFDDVRPGFPDGAGLDYAYLYLNGGGQLSEWPGKVDRLVAGAARNRMVPVFVVYGANGDADSAAAVFANLQDPVYLEVYFAALAAAAARAAAAAGDGLVGYVIEPDLLGYLQQQYAALYDDNPAQMPAATHAAYAAGALVRGEDPDLPDSLAGLVAAINHTIRRHGGPNAFLGWQLNLWGAPGGGGNGICHATETLGQAAGRARIREVASALADFAGRAGIAAAGAELVSIDKYGLDGAGAAGANPDDPASSVWFWSADLWSNYLVFVDQLHERLGLPVVLWQIPVGHVNTTTRPSPVAHNPSGVFPALPNTLQRYEDSASSWLFGDTFTTSGARRAYFARNDAGDPEVTVAGDAITWGRHLDEAADAGVVAVLFGAGVGAATRGVPQPSGPTPDQPTDGHYWITRVQEYYADPVPLPGP